MSLLSDLVRRRLGGAVLAWLGLASSVALRQLRGPLTGLRSLVAAVALGGSCGLATVSLLVGLG